MNMEGSVTRATGYVKVARTDEIHETRGTMVHVNGEDVAIFKREGEYFAISNVCAHQHFSMLHDGLVEGFSVTCPMHGWTYDIRTGQATTGQGRVACHDLKIEDQCLLIRICNTR